MLSRNLSELKLLKNPKNSIAGKKNYVYISVIIKMHA
jgi:hypothetical protein